MTRALLSRGRPREPLALLAPLLFLAIPGLPACGSDAASPMAYDVERYDLAAEYDWDRDRLVATLGITVTVTEPGTALTLDSAVASVTSVRSASGDDLPFTADTAARTLTIDLSALGPQDPGARLELAVDYEASPGDGLSAVRERAGDPVPTRVLFTDSEPLDAAEWMPCNDRPDDRALFSVDMKMPPAERMIANGDLVLDEGGGDSPRRMKYQTSYSLPPYLMAFAVGELEVEEAQSGDLPISVWHRPGVAGNYPGTLAELSRLLDTFQPLLGPYPFEKYALVMVPNFGGGMENASISFQSEVSGAEPALSLPLIAHELGHQWWGDAVTVASWDDLWIKEGMAVLLENEAARAFDDESGRGSLFGERCYVVSGEAARDRSLPPLEKYTTGPYDRGAWIFTQIRHEIGEEAFWATLRDLLESNRFGAVSTDALVAAFEPHLGAAATERLRAAIDARDVPYLDVQTQSPGGVRVTLHDPGGLLIAPLEIEWHREDGATERSTIDPEQPLSLAREGQGDFLVVDPDDTHPSLWRFLLDDPSWDAYWADLAPLQVPASPATIPSFSELPGILQTSALLEGRLPPIPPDQLADFSDSLDSETARATLLSRACERASDEADPATLEVWTAVLTTELTAEPHWRGLPHAPRLSACSAVVSPLALFDPEWDELSGGLASPTLSVERVHYLSSFDLPFQDGLDAWAAAAASAHSLRVRAVAARYLRSRSLATAGEGDMALWRAAVLALVDGNRSSEVLRQILPAAASFADAPVDDRGAFQAALVDVVRSPDTRPAHATAVCAAYDLTTNDPSAWTTFVAAARDAPLGAQARILLEDPARCE